MPASKLKKAFKPVFPPALKDGANRIIGNRKREAILVSTELSAQIVIESLLSS